MIDPTDRELFHDAATAAAFAAAAVDGTIDFHLDAA